VVAELKGQNAKLAKELAEAKACLAAAASGADADGMCLDQSGEDATREVGKTEIKAMRGQLGELRKLPSEVKARAGVSAEIALLEDQLQAAERAAREAKPLDAQLASAEAHAAKMCRLLAEAKLKTDDIIARQAELENQLSEHLLATSGIEAKEAAAREELAKVKSEMARSLSSEAAAHAASARGPTDCVDPAGIAVPQGCVSIKHAEAVLAEQLALRDAALAEAIAAVEAAPVENDEETASNADSATGTTGEDRKQRARRLRSYGAKATLAHVRSRNFAKPRWGSWG